VSRRAPGRRPARPASSGGGTNTARALILLVVAVVVAVVLLGRLGSHHSSSSATKDTATTTTVPRTTTTTTAVAISPNQIKLQVLNGLINGSISAEFSAKLKAAYGYDTLAPNDTTKVVTTSSIWVVTPGKGYLNAAYVLAEQVGLPRSAVQTAEPTVSNSSIPTSVLAEANLVLVVGSSLASKA
jgi:hypothetical protein